MKFTMEELEMLRSGLGVHEGEYNVGNGNPYWPKLAVLYARIDAEIVQRGGESDPMRWTDGDEFMSEE